MVPQLMCSRVSWHRALENDTCVARDNGYGFMYATCCVTLNGSIVLVLCSTAGATNRMMDDYGYGIIPITALGFLLRITNTIRENCKLCLALWETRRIIHLAYPSTSTTLL